MKEPANLTWTPGVWNCCSKTVSYTHLMDGVLADTEYYYENRRKNFLLENGIPIPEGNFIGSNEKAIWEAIVPNAPVRRQEMLMAYREYRQVRPTPYGKLTDPQAEPLMNALRSRGPVSYTHLHPLPRTKN